MSNFVSRGFQRRRQTPAELADRVPPGQYVENGFPVLTAGPTPHVEAELWGFRIDGMVGAEQEWTWDEFRALPFLINNYHAAIVVGIITVAVELLVLAIIRARFFRTGFLRSFATVTLGGVIIVAVSAALGSAA